MREYVPLWRHGRRLITKAVEQSANHSILATAENSNNLEVEFSSSSGDRLLVFAFLIQFDENKLGRTKKNLQDFGVSFIFKKSIIVPVPVINVVVSVAYPDPPDPYLMVFFVPYSEYGSGSRFFKNSTTILIAQK